MSGAVFAVAPAVALAVVLVAFGVARVRGRYDTIDSVWGAGFAVIALASALVGPGSALGWTATALTGTLNTVSATQASSGSNRFYRTQYATPANLLGAGLAGMAAFEGITSQDIR